MSSKKQQKTPKKAARKKAAPKTPKAKAVSTNLLETLVDAARAVRENAYAPYSNYKVGAAIATKSGKTFVGCNVENASYGGTICAERGAIMAMVAAGEREPVACAVVTEDQGSPCGICRQILSELARDDMPIAMVGIDDEGEAGRVVSLGELLPYRFVLRK